MTVKAATSEQFFYRCDPKTGTVIYKINLWTLLTSPGGSLGSNVGRISVDASGKFAYVNYPFRMFKIRLGIDIDLADRIVWETAVGVGSVDLSLPPDGDPRAAAVRYDKDTGLSVWGVFAGTGTRQDSGLSNSIVWATTASGPLATSASLRVFKHDDSGSLEWFTDIDTTTGGVNSGPLIRPFGVRVADNGNIWVAYELRVAVGLNVEWRYRLKMLDQNGVLIANQPWAAGEAPSIESSGTDMQLERTPGRGAATWRYTLFSPLTRRTKQINNQNSEIDTTTNHTAASHPRRFVRGNTGDYKYTTLSGEVGKFEPDLVTAVAGFTPVALDAGIHRCGHSQFNLSRSG
jgi:hypothetical protein